MAYSVGPEIGDTKPVTSATRARFITLLAPPAVLALPLVAPVLPLGAVELALEPTELVELLADLLLDEHAPAPPSNASTSKIEPAVLHRRPPARNIFSP
jgi:hypothetical protein